ncbi:MAG: DUF2207 domain-containing protein [Rhizobiaceae bacterium]|jgi:uncharacterized membrane protein YgcG|nr:DUF2207 domain-containing protein [Rhizobiaceae bacterium]
MLARALALVLILVAALAPARAAEEILDYAARIGVGTDGVLDVTETIIVNSEGERIRRGIYRDFPLRFIDQTGDIKEVSFDVVSVTRDGREEPYRLEFGSGIVRVYVGSADVLLFPGEHTYEIRYTTDRQIRAFDTHDELYWNVTGNAWDFPIRRASALVILPDGARANDLAVYTGGFGSTASNAVIQPLQGGARVTATTTRALGPREGLTIAVGFPKGFIAAPTSAQLWAWFWRDHAGSIIALGGLLIAGVYYLRSWLRVGRDPARGVMVPRWDMPAGVSPALVHYIDRKGISGDPWRAISAAVLSLAVKGLVTLEDLASDVVIKATGKKPVGALPVGERQVLAQVEAADGALAVDKANGKRIVALQSAFTTAMTKEHRDAYYKHNTGYIIGGVILSAVIVFAAVIFGRFDENGIVGLVGLAVVGVALTVLTVRWGRARPTGLGGRILLIISSAVIGFFAVAIGGAMLLALTDSTTSPFLIGGLAALLMLNVLFFFLMGAPTEIGRDRMDEIEGLRTYLTVAEEDRMNMQGAPEMSPRHYETLLPYAVALNVEKPWSRAFQNWLVTAAAAGAAAATGYYGPGWYRGRDFSPDRIGDSLGGLAGSLADSMTASLPAPQASSSGLSGGSFGGGGFSGGGGGGGGGGGW